MAERRKEKRALWPNGTGGAKVASQHEAVAPHAGQKGSRTPNDFKGPGPFLPARGRYPAIRAAIQAYLLALISTGLLTLALPPAEISWLAYLALIPLIIMAVRTQSGGRVFRAAWLAGTVFFAINLYWLWIVTKAGCLAVIPYLGLYWAAFAWVLRRMFFATRLPLTILAPVLWVALELVRAWGLLGLPWIYVGHTQYENLALIQISDTLGAYGVSFLVLMTAGLVTDFLTRPLFVKASSRDRKVAGTPERVRRFSPLLIAMAALTAAAWAGTVGYGLWRLGQSGREAGPVVASIQTCVPQELKQEARLRQIEELEEKMLAEQIDLTDQALAKARQEGLKADFIIWPETMVPGIQNQEFLEGDLAKSISDPDMLIVFNYLQRRSRMYWEKVRQAAAADGAPILFGAHACVIEGAYRLPGGGYMPRGPRYNTAYLVAPDTKPYAAVHTYAKCHLVPFGEYLPLEFWPGLRNWLLTFTPYTYDYSLTPGGHDQAPFVLQYEGREARFQVPICYEDAMPYRVREMVRSSDPARPKAVDFLVNISNDGWFGGSIELDQHLNLCVFRAVENRVPIVRSVNTGISAIIASDGRIETVVQQDGRRRWITGGIVGRLGLDDRAAPYTEIGDAFALACLAASLALAAATIVIWLRKRKEAPA